MAVLAEFMTLSLLKSGQYLVDLQRRVSTEPLSRKFLFNGLHGRTSLGPPPLTRCLPEAYL